MSTARSKAFYMKQSTTLPTHLFILFWTLEVEVRRKKKKHQRTGYRTSQMISKASCSVKRAETAHHGLTPFPPGDPPAAAEAAQGRPQSATGGEMSRQGATRRAGGPPALTMAPPARCRGDAPCREAARCYDRARGRGAPDLPLRTGGAGRRPTKQPRPGKKGQRPQREAGPGPTDFHGRLT